MSDYKYELGKCLFPHGGETGLWGWRVKQRPKTFDASALNYNVVAQTHNDIKKATVNVAARSLGRFFQDKLKVSVSTPVAGALPYMYIEYIPKTTTDAKVCMAVTHDMQGFRVWSKEELSSSLDPAELKSLSAQRAITAIVCYMLLEPGVNSDPGFRKLIPAGDKAMDELLKYFKEICTLKETLPLSDINEKPVCVAQFCDALYSGFALADVISGTKSSFLDTTHTVDSVEYTRIFNEMQAAGMKAVSLSGADRNAQVGSDPAQVKEEKISEGLADAFSRNPLLKKIPMKAGKINVADLMKEDLNKYFQRCKEGQFVIPYEEWKTVCKGNANTGAIEIAPLDILDDFTPTPEFRDLHLSMFVQLLGNYRKVYGLGEKLNDRYVRQHIIGSFPMNFRLVGPPGTGKTVTIRAAAASVGIPIGFVNCTSNSEEDKFEGLNKIRNGSISTILTNVGKIHSKGGLILLEEFNLPKPGVMTGALNDPLEGGALMVDGYVAKFRHPMTVYIATMNEDTAGVNEVNEALLSRFAETFYVEATDKEALIRSFVDKGFSEGDCRQIVGVYLSLLEYLEKESPDLMKLITRRHCQIALRKIADGFTIEKALEHTFINALRSIDRDLGREVANAIRLWY